MLPGDCFILGDESRFVLEPAVVSWELQEALLTKIGRSMLRYLQFLKNCFPNPWICRLNLGGTWVLEPVEFVETTNYFKSIPKIKGAGSSAPTVPNLAGFPTR